MSNPTTPTATPLAPALSPNGAGAEPEKPSDVMLNKREVAERLKVTVRTIENWQQRGVLPYVKVGKIVLFHWPEVIEFLKSNFRVCRRAVSK